MNRLLELPLFIRIAICAMALSALAILFATRTFPGVPMLILFAWMIGAVAVAGMLLIAYFVVVAGWHTWSLDHGATDTQWLWFDGEPPGLQALREESERLRHQH